MTKIKEGQLRIWWVPDPIPEPFTVLVTTIEEGVRMLEALNSCEAFQVAHCGKVSSGKPLGDVNVYRDGEWESLGESADYVKAAMTQLGWNAESFCWGWRHED